MDLSTDSSSLSTSNMVGGLALERELRLSGDRCQTLSEGTILLQLVEFKTHLLEVVEELHIRRDAETRFEDQISKLVLEKQELEWEKEGLQHQTETVAKQHTESLINVKKQFQAKIKSLEEEKGKYQVIAEVKDKEINNLKEELKSLQLLKYNLEKKTSELEQKLALQSRSKDVHLNQLGEVEKRFSALSRQCAMVKQAHEKLEQNVDEAMKRNEKLTSANANQEATIVSLKKELEDISNNLMKAKMSSFRNDESHSPTDSELRFQQLQQRLNKETKINETLMEENVAARAQKQEVMRSLQYAQQLLLSQTQTVSRVELDLQTQKEQYQALKQEHEVMRDRSKAAEDKLAQLMEGYAASRTSWDKEKAMFLDRIKTEQQELKGVTGAYDELDHKHTELSSQVKVQAQLICELEKRDGSQGCHVCANPLPSSKEEIQGEETLNKSMSSLETSSFGSLQDSTQTKKPDHQNYTRAGTLPAVNGATGGQDVQVSQMHKYQQSETEQPPSISDQLTCTLTNSKNESEPDVFPLLTHASVCDDCLPKSNTRCVSNIFSESSTCHTSINKPLDSIRKEHNDVGRTEGWTDDVTPGKQNIEEQNENEARQWSEEEIQEDAKKGQRAGETRGTLVAQTTDRADRSEDSQRSTEDAEDTKQPERETEDRAEGAGSDGVEERRKTEPHILEPQIQTQTTADTIAESSDTQQVIDFVDTEPTLAACAPSDYTQSPFEKDRKMVEDASHLNRGFETRREVRTSYSGEHRSASHEANSGTEEVQRLSHHNVQKHAQDLNLEKMLEMTDSNPTASISNECVIPQNQSSIYSSKTGAAGLSSETGQTRPTDSSDVTSIMKQRHVIYETHVKKDGLLLESVFELQSLPQSPRISGQEHCDHSGNSQTFEKREAQSNLGKCNNAACEPAQGAEGKSDVVDVSVDNRSDTTEFKTNVEMGKEQNDKVEVEDEAKKTKRDADLQLPACSSQEMNVAPQISSTKCDEETPAKKILLDDNNKTFLPSSMAYRSAFDWCSIQRKAVSSRTKSDVFSLHQFVQGSLLPERNTSGSGRLHRQASSTIPMFLKSKHNKVPLVISRVSELLNASSVSGSADFSRRHRERGDSKGTAEAATGVTGCRDALSISSFPVSTSSMVFSRPPLATSGLSRAPSSAAGQTSDMDLSFSQEQEEQQSSLRAQIAKIEQFLSAERLRLPKRPRTDN